MILLSEEHRLYGVEVPGEAEAIEKWDNELVYYSNGSHYSIEKAHFDFEILGTITSEAIDFDCEPYIFHNDIRLLRGKESYKANGLWFEFADDAFRSLIESKSGKYFVNPYGEEPPHNIGLISDTPTGNLLIDASHKAAKNWQQAQQNLMQKMVIIQKLN